jgi:TonB family protein
VNIPEEFGNYLLLKKLREDALGETFRAGRVGRDGIEQVVLLRVLNGQGMDGERLWQRVSARGAVQQALRSPNIGSGVDLGKVRSFPYAAYDYVSGKNLATLFAQASRQRMPVPVDHALLISERVALALAAAYETRAQDDRVLHGFAVPHLVMISNEGEARLLGFEVAPGLRELWAGGWRADDLAGYLAPEAAASAAIAKSDDVYSLGVILFELLSSERLPAPPGGGYAQMIDALVLPNEGTPLPPGIAALLKNSLGPREQRLADAQTWHKTISKLMIEGHYSSTTFNLAFFMHSLFRDEIDRESQEIEAERKLELPRRATAPAPAAAAPLAGAAAPAAGSAGAGPGSGNAGAPAAGDMRERTGVRDAAWASTAAPAAAAAGRKPLWIGVAAGALIVLGLGGYLLFGRSGGAGARPAAAATSGSAAVPQAGAGSAAEAAKNAAALQAQIQQMIEARSKEMETKLKGQYDDQIKQLQKKLEDSRRAAADPEREKPARAERSSSGAQTESSSSSSPPTVESRQARAERTDAQPPLPAASRSVVTPPAQPAAAQREAAAGSQPPASSAPIPANPAPATTPPAADSGAVSRPPQIQVGDLVQPGPGVVSPKLLFRPEAHYPAAARRLNRRAEVVVRVLVDERGRVQQAERQGDAAGLGFDEAALEVARRSNYQPATKQGVQVKMWTSMKITFVPVGGG